MLTLTALLRSSARYDRHGVVRLPAAALTGLGLAEGGVVCMRGRRTTGAVAVRAPGDCPPGVALCDELLLSNLGLVDGDTVVLEAHARREATTVTVAGPAGVTQGLDPQVLRTALLGKVVTTGDQVSLRPSDLAPPVDFAALRKRLNAWLGTGWTGQVLHVVASAPQGPAVVTMGSVVGWQGGPATHSSATPLLPAYAPAGRDGAVAGPTELPGLESQSAALKEWLELGFHHPELLRRLGTTASMGVLVTGSAGSGKAALVESVAAEVGARLLRAWAPAIAAVEPNAAAKQVVDLFGDAVRTAPAVVLLEDIESLAPREGGPLLAAFLTAVEDVIRDGRISVVCTTAHPDRVAPALRAPGMLDHEIAIPLPDRAQRLRLLEAATRAVPLASDVRLDDIAGRAPGFVAADVQALVREAGLRAAARQRDDDSPVIAAADFDGALEVVQPTAMEGVSLDIETLSLDDVGDMAEVKTALTEAVLWPLQYPDTFARLGVSAPRGVLLYGPPGCGKTFLVKAIAGSGECNVVSVKGAEVLTKWVGESERAVRDLFRRARDAAPTLVFLDELDALAPVRGQATDGGTTDRVVAALLTEMDGVEQLRDVVVIGATNRPDLIDPALLRPGRLERLVYVPPPDTEARAAILAAAAKGVPLAADVDLSEVAAKTEGFSAADCAALVREAALTAMRESFSAATVTAAHVLSALARVRPSLDPTQVAALAAYADERRPA